MDVEKDDEDRRLVHRHLSGDPSGFEGLYRRHRERIFAVLVRMLRNREDALEATQEVFIRIHRGLDSFDASGRFLTWAYRIATNHAIDRIRRRKVRKETAIVEEVVTPTSDLRTGRSQPPGGAERLEREEVAAAIQQAVDRLADTHRIVFTPALLRETLLWRDRCSAGDSDRHRDVEALSCTAKGQRRSSSRLGSGRPPP